MKPAVLLIALFCLALGTAAQDSVSVQREYGFALRYRPLIVWNGIGAGYYLHPNHSVEVYGTGQATIELLDAQLVLERSLFLEYRYYVVNRKKTRWFLAPYFKHGRGDYVPIGDYDLRGWYGSYFRDNAIGAVVGFQFMKRDKKRGRAYAEVFVGPQYIFRSTPQLYYGDNPTGEENRIFKEQDWGFVRFGINFCYDFYRKRQ